MARYSAYQRSMMSDAARTRRSSANTESAIQALSADAARANAVNANLLHAQNMLSADIARATEENNRLQLERLEIERHRLKIQEQEAVARREEEAKRDEQAFAMWIQTPNGKAFVDWYLIADAQIDEIHANDRNWRDIVDALKKDWKDTRREQVEFATFDPTERNKETAKYLFIGAGVCAALWMIFLAIGIIGAINAIWIVGALALAAAGIWRRISTDKPARQAAFNDLAAHGAAELGFNPLGDEVPPWATTDVLAYSERLARFAIDAYTSHPSAQALPQLFPYTFVDRSTVIPGALKEMLPQ